MGYIIRIASAKMYHCFKFYICNFVKFFFFVCEDKHILVVSIEVKLI
jgi:hypothetical protein